MSDHCRYNKYPHLSVIYQNHPHNLTQDLEKKYYHYETVQKLYPDAINKRNIVSILLPF